MSAEEVETGARRHQEVMSGVWHLERRVSPVAPEGRSDEPTDGGGEGTAPPMAAAVIDSACVARLSGLPLARGDGELRESTAAETFDATPEPCGD